MHAKSLQLCPTLCDPMDSSSTGSSVHGILWARILEWVAISFSKGNAIWSNLSTIFVQTRVDIYRHEILSLHNQGMMVKKHRKGEREFLKCPKLGAIVSSSQFSCSVVSDSLQPHGLQHTRPPCPSPTPGITQTHVYWDGNAIQPSHPLWSPSPPAPNPSQHQGLFK